MVETYDGRTVENRIDPDPSPQMVEQARRADPILIASCKQVGVATGRYNCHGLVFASRRTNIPLPGTESAELIERILAEDCYEQINAAEVREGDILLYRNSKTREVDHSALVVRIDEVGAVRVISVWSMWGNLGEFVHRADVSPYHDCIHEYWRLGI